MKVLNKTSQKLDLEMQVLQLQKDRETKLLAGGK
jgi:hypothetical protein